MAQSRPDIPGDVVPKTRANAEPGSVKLTREDRQVLARIDGSQNIDSIARKTGLDMAKVQGILRFLSERRLIDVPGMTVATGPRPAMADQSGPRPAGSPPPRPAVSTGTLSERLMQPLPRGEHLEPMVEEVFAAMETISYYELLGIRRSATETEVKKAYLFRTKAFHPDRFYRRATLDFKHKLQEIFKQVNKGYRTLTDPALRKTYDESLVKIEKAADGPEVKFTPAATERTVRGQIHSDRPYDKAGKAAPIKTVAEPAPEAEVKRATEETPAGAPAKFKLGLRPGEKKLPDYIAKAIKDRARDQQSTVTQAERFFQGAMHERGRGNFSAARVNLKLAMQYAPYEAKYKAALDDLSRDEESNRAESQFRAGIEAQATGDLQGAISFYRQALQLGYENAKLYHKLADLIIELDANFEKARALCLKAIEMQPGVADFHFTLARAYKGLGQKGAAILQLDKGLALDPKNKLALKELKALKRS